MKRIQLKEDLSVNWWEDKRYQKNGETKILTVKKITNECLKSLAKILRKEI